jgi:phosphate transport system substrate-binding protein
MKNIFVILLFFSAVFCYGQFVNISDVSASSYLSDSNGSYKAEYLTDRSWRSWAEGARGNGVGESFTLTLYRLSSGNDTIITGFVIKNGYGNIDLFAKNNRVKAFKIYADGKFIETIVIKDSVSFEQYYFKKPVECKDEIRFEIADVYRGTMYDDTCVAEIALLDKKYDDKTFYENIIRWVSGYNEELDTFMSFDEKFGGRWLASVSDADKLMLLDYLPFDLTGDFTQYKRDENYNRVERKTKIARLRDASSLRLTNNLPRIDGATAMYPLYSSFVRAVYPARQPVIKDEIYIALLEWDYYPSIDLYNRNYGGEGVYYKSEQLKSIVQCNTTSKAYERLINGETDIIFCYEPSQAEIKAAAAKGKRLYLTPICKDAFIFIVNAKNAVSNLTQQQIRDIYSGRVTNWKTISGVEEPIIAYQRPENSGSQTILQSIMKGDRIMRPILEGETVPGGMFSMLEIVTSTFYNYNCAIGYTFLFYLNQMAGSVGIKTLSIDGIAPNKQNIQSNKYPFTQTVYAVTTGNESENTKKFIEWILSPQGQELAEKTGYIPIR